ncbi:hypothetical protein D3C76_1058050 [compost metagenome]
MGSAQHVQLHTIRISDGAIGGPLSGGIFLRRDPVIQPEHLVFTHAQTARDITRNQRILVQRTIRLEGHRIDQRRGGSRICRVATIDGGVHGPGVGRIVLDEILIHLVFIALAVIHRGIEREVVGTCVGGVKRRYRRGGCG